MSLATRLLAGDFRHSWRKAARDALGHKELASPQRYLSSTQERVAWAGLAVSEALLAHT